MEVASLPECGPAAGPRRSPGQIRELLGIALVVFFAQEPRQTLEDVKTGLSNGTIWVLIALGYKLVYGSIELINFAHGEAS